MRGGRLTLLGVGFGAVVFAAGCAVTATDETAPETSEVTHALVAIERSVVASTPEVARAQAFAGFLRVPAGAEPTAVLPLVGLGLDLPAPDACRIEPAASADSTLLTAVELLDAGEVTLAAGGAVTTLAPRAFPSVTDSISGVVYTTRDRASEPLPAAARYTIATSGSAALDPISVDASAPQTLEDVSLGGEPLGSPRSLPAASALSIAWRAGAPNDLVVVELSSGSFTSVCTFRDASGHGIVPAHALPGPGEADLSVHRLRKTPFVDASLAGGELRFDFELSEPVLFE